MTDTTPEHDGLMSLGEIEEWRVVLGFPDYEVSNLGRVMRSTLGASTRPGRVLKQNTDYYGYLRVCLCRDGKKTTMKVHRLVCVAFHGSPLDPKLEVAHYDGDPANNNAPNLRWVTSSENKLDSIRHGTFARHRGEINGNAKLNECQVVWVRSQAEIGVSQEDLAKAVGITQANISKIVRRETWKHL